MNSTWLTLFDECINMLFYAPKWQLKERAEALTEAATLFHAHGRITDSQLNFLRKNAELVLSW